MDTLSWIDTSWGLATSVASLEFEPAPLFDAQLRALEHPFRNDFTMNRRSALPAATKRRRLSIGRMLTKRRLNVGSVSVRRRRKPTNLADCGTGPRLLAARHAGVCEEGRHEVRLPGAAACAQAPRRPLASCSFGSFLVSLRFSSVSCVRFVFALCTNVTQRGILHGSWRTHLGLRWVCVAASRPWRLPDPGSAESCRSKKDMSTNPSRGQTARRLMSRTSDCLEGLVIFQRMLMLAATEFGLGSSI